MGRILSFLTGAVIGAMVGATVGLLLAPLSGEDLRTEIQSRSQEIQAEVKQAATNRRAEMEQQLAAMRKPRPS